MISITLKNLKTTRKEIKFILVVFNLRIFIVECIILHYLFL